MVERTTTLSVKCASNNSLNNKYIQNYCVQVLIRCWFAFLWQITRNFEREIQYLLELFYASHLIYCLLSFYMLQFAQVSYQQINLCPIFKYFIFRSLLLFLLRRHIVYYSQRIRLGKIIKLNRFSNFSCCLVFALKLFFELRLESHLFLFPRRH